MKCHICNTDNSKKSCQHYDFIPSKLQKGDSILIKREVAFPTMKPIISRVIRGIENNMVWCDDNIEYPIEQIIECK